MAYLKFKDGFTLLNLFLAFYAVVLLFDGKLEFASYLLLFNALVLDILDGMVARATKTSNLFGKHLDSITDFFGSSMIIPFFLYFVLKDYNRPYAIAVAFLPLVVGVLREIQQRLEDIKVKGFFIGFPRSSAGVVLIAFLNTRLVANLHLYWLVLPMTLYLCYTQLSHTPYVGNDKSMLMKIPRMKFYLTTCIVLLIGLSIAGYFWEAVVVSMGFYLLSSHILIEKSVWDDIKRQVKALAVD